MWKEVDVSVSVFQVQPSREAVLCIMVSNRNIDLDAGRGELTHPIGKENPCAVVTPLAIEYFVTDHEKAAFLVDCGLDQIVNGPA